jgi:septum site-determining protein MinC
LENIHVYGILRGRALAGIEGDENAQIFCQHLEADLVSVAGIYRINDEIPEELRNNPAQIQIQGSELLITSL